MSENGRHTAFTTDTKQKPTVLFFEQVRHAAQILADDIEFKVDHRTRFQRMEIGMLIRIRNYANLKSIFCGMAYREAHAVDGHRTFIHTKIAPLHHPGIKSMAESIDEKHLRERFFACTGMKWEALADITYFEYIPGYNEKISNYPFTRACIWQDILLGLCDSNMLGMDMSEHFASLAEKMRRYAEEYPQLKTVFEFYAALGDAVEKKQYMGIALADMYKNGDKDGLRRAAEEELPELYRRMCNLRKAHRDYFFWEYKPIGWEILDIRYGGAIMRIDTAIMRIKSYLSGDIKRLDELEELRLSFTGKEGEVIPGVLTYQMLCSASRL